MINKLRDSDPSTPTQSGCIALTMRPKPAPTVASSILLALSAVPVCSGFDSEAEHLGAAHAGTFNHSRTNFRAFQPMPLRCRMDATTVVQHDSG